MQNMFQIRALTKIGKKHRQRKRRVRAERMSRPAVGNKQSVSDDNRSGSKAKATGVKRPSGQASSSIRSKEDLATSK